MVERYEELLSENTDRKRAITRATDNQFFDDNNQSPDSTKTEHINGSFPFNGRQGFKTQFQRNNQSTIGSASQSQGSSMHNEMTNTTTE